MKHITGKQIDTFVSSLYRNDIPVYYGIYDHIGYGKKKYYKGSFLASKYNAMAEIITEMKASVLIQKDNILITHATGEMKVCRDILTDTFLIPLINQLYPIN